MFFMLFLEVNNISDKDWNKRLQSYPFGTIYQTKEIAEKGQFQGEESLFLKFLDPNDVVVGQLMISIVSRFRKKNIRHWILNKLPFERKKYYYWEYGPVIFDPNYTNEIKKELFGFLKSQNCKVSGYEHPLSNRFFSDAEKPFHTRTWGTFLIDLTLSKDQIWRNMDKNSVRKNIQRATKKGIYVKQMTKTDLFEYTKLLQKTHKEIRFDLEIIKKQWDFLHPIGLTGFLAYENDIPVGGILVPYFNKYMNEWGVARSEFNIEKRLYAQELLKWKIIEFGIENGCKYYDLSGVNPNPDNKKEEGIFRFKRKFGGVYKKYNYLIL